MPLSAAQCSSTWAEDTALLRSNRSAAPGAETGDGARHHVAPHSALPRRLQDQHQSAKPSRHEAAKSPTRCPSQLANANRPKFQFPLNQDMWAWQGDLSRAKAGEFAPGCWFFPDAEVRLIGCITSGFAADWAKSIGRYAGAAHGTNRPTWAFNAREFGWGDNPGGRWIGDRSLGVATTPEDYFKMKYWVKHEGKN